MEATSTIKDSLRPLPITLKHYYKMAEVGILEVDKRYELLNGLIYETQPVRPEHAHRVEHLRRALEACVLDKAVIVTQYPLQIDDTNEPQPDLIVLRPPLEKYRNQHPTPQDVLLVIEVANTTLHTDRHSKLKLYAKAGIPEYWILNLLKPQLEIYRNPDSEEGRYREVLTLNKDEPAFILVFGCKVEW